MIVSRATFLASSVALTALLLSINSATTFASPVDCGEVTIESFRTGPQNGSMIKITSSACGLESKWVCLDPNGEGMGVEKSARLFSHLLSLYNTERSFRLKIENDTKVRGCAGNHPIVWDVISE